ncbi:AfsR family transcriptional regulator [Saccharothrix yanglingensis]|uniref:AfsR family transcriptional regulator n=2 Tax=Saccharothrix yanglingensis TaxID=659496 RepID=A0ABU0X9R2_9PSEU|nr:AfsR family transcriptional regulator [Saccharothrix yanglingensis]
MSYGVRMTERGPGTGGVPRALSSFVGRKDLLAELRRRIGTAPLITLTGVGGGGKTRLALELAAQVQRAYDDGVRVVELAPARGGDPELLAQVVLSAVGVPDQATTTPLETLVEYLAPRRMLLVLDNCEHLVEPVGHLVREVLGAAPGVRVLTTSRARLRVPGEVLVMVPPLDVPAEDAPLDLAHESVALLVDRAAASVPGWRITEDNWPHVVRVLRRVAGIPLAVEQAVVRMRSMPVELLADRLDDVMRVLTVNDTTAVPHHRTMRALIGWSHDQCTPAERLLWARLSVFEGGFSLPAAEAVCAGDGLDATEVADALAGLLDKSIALPSADRSRYHLLEPLRQHGAARLRASGEAAGVRERHRRHFRGEAARLAASFTGRNEALLLDAVDRDMANHRVVLADLIGDPATAHAGLQMSVDLARTRWYTYAGRLPEERLWLGRALAAVPPAADPLRASAIALDAWIALCLGVERSQVARRVDEATALARAVGVPLPAVTFVRGAFAVLALGSVAGADLLRQAHAEFGDLGPDFAVDEHLAHIMLTVSLVLLSPRERAEPAAEEFFASCERLGAPWGLSWAHWCRGVVETRWGDPERALEVLREGLRVQRAIRDKWGPLWTIEGLGWAHAKAGQAQAAARMLGLAHGLHRVTGVRVDGLVPFAAHSARAVRRARAVLGDDAYGRAYSSRAESVENALAAVLDADDEDEVPTSPRPAGLTPAEWNVARLVGDGLSNPEVASRLVISPATVHTHLTRIYRKLDIANRHQLITLLAGKSD